MCKLCNDTTHDEGLAAHGRSVSSFEHWHGATPTTAMTHIAITGMKNGKNVEWLEKVSDEQYKSGSAKVTIEPVEQ